jgi:hypothetical protein
MTETAPRRKHRATGRPHGPASRIRAEVARIVEALRGKTIGEIAAALEPLSGPVRNAAVTDLVAEAYGRGTP